MAATGGRLLLMVAVAMATEADSPLPDLSMSVRRPIEVTAGRDALLTCVVNNLGNHTLLWKRVQDQDGEEEMPILTAGGYRVTKDSRIMVLHDSARRRTSDVFHGGDVFVLAIQNTSFEDTGMYVCEVNSSPVVRSYHQLTVSQPGALVDISKVSRDSYDYTPCCLRHNVSDSCIGLCNLSGLHAGNQSEEADCETDFPHIIQCMADGRNHLPCCEEQGVPDMCSGICRGQYFSQKDSIKDHFSCVTFSSVMLNCVARGLDTLPIAPENVQVSVSSLTELQVQWTQRRTQAPPPDLFMVNVTRLRQFDGDALGQDLNVTEPPPQRPQDTRLYNVTAERLFLIADALEPLTMYEVSVTAHNAAGSSLTSGRVRAVTWVEETRNRDVSLPPGLPDVRQCCEDSGVTEPRCLRQLCDPRVASDTVVTDVIICAPWAEKTFACMADGQDHSACCRARGLPQICVDLCAGNVTKIDFRYFRCLGFMGSYASCLMQGYGVVPSAPVDPRVALVDSSFAVLRWNPPSTLADTVTSYTVMVRASGSGSSEDDGEDEGERDSTSKYMTYAEVHSPFLLGDLRPDAEYEFLVEAVNLRGAGPQSSRVLFKTMPEEMLVEEATQSSYNLSTCCMLAEMSLACLPLCHYDARMSTMKGLAHICAPEYHKLLRCSAGGRDHSACCERRGVPSSCLPACRGEGPLASECTPYLGNLWQCYEEGTGRLPAPVTGLHATSVTNTSVTLIWEEAEDANVTDFTVRYGVINADSRNALNMDVLNMEMNISEQFALVINLTTGKLYGFTVVSVNEYGTSLPSSIITINVTDQIGDVMHKAVTSHPHSLSVSDLAATQLTVSWAPPVISHPTERLRYRLSYRGPNATEYTNITTAALLHRLVDLVPNSQYSVFVTALSALGESRPSETLQMWTSPAYPAYVELPTIHPTDMVKEGGSMTVLCIAMAAPEPTVALYVNGRHVTEGRTRHLVTTIRNVTRDMSQVTCYADNGYGPPMQSTRHVVISRRPEIRTRPSYTSAVGESITLRCKVDASPEPQMVFFRDPAQRQAVIDGGNYVITLDSSRRKEGDHTMELMIKSVTDEDFGNFYCHAENVFGGMTKMVTLTKREEPPKLYNLGIGECCRRMNVSQPCQRACAFDVDLDAVLAMPECASEMGKLMACAADGSDHRRCCAKKIVPTRCLDWCRGEPVAMVEECSLGHAKEIVDCFEEGKNVLPGPPLNVRVEAVSSNTVRVRWDAPDKNADKVEVYRVYWRAPGDKISSRNDTRSTSMRLSHLRAGVEYECAVKSGNHYGSSQLTSPVLFVPGQIFVSSQSTDDNYYLGTGTVLAVVLVLLLVLVVMLVGVVMYRRKRRKASGADRVSFENPSYLREMNLENLQNTSESSFTGGLNNGNHGNHLNGDATTPSANGHRQMSPQSTGSQSASPARFGALRNGLGLVAKKAGFKQFENEQ